MMDRYALVGSPVHHSISPQVHSLFADQTDQVMDYVAIEVKPDEFIRRVRQLADDGFKGLNVTVPLKNLAWEFADIRDDHAELAGAVNVFKFDPDGTSRGYNTDGIGLLRDLTQNHGVELKHRRVLVLGAGGAVQGVIVPLLSAEPESIMIANRTVAKAEAIVRRFRKFGNLQSCGYEALADRTYDLVINGTSMGLLNEVPPLPDTVLNPGGYAYDMMYGRKPTAFVKWGQQHGAAKSLDGTGMLIEQAAETFWIWRGVRPETAPVIRELKSG
jgi:shikimate dehydrogenase